MKKICAFALSLSLAASLAVPALATEAGIMPISAPIQTASLTYACELTVNGVKLDAATLPAADTGYIPGRLVAESDHGSASWYEEENTGAFYFDGLYVSVSFADNSITIGEEKQDASAIVKNGVTFLPVSIFNGVEGYTVSVEESKIDIVTPNNDPLVKLGYSIVDQAAVAAGMKSDAKSFFENFGLDYTKNVESAVIFQGMNITPDTLLIAKLTDGADVPAVKAALEQYRKAQEDTFSWYLSHNLPKVQNAKTVVNGDYVLFLIAEDSDKGVELFNAFVAEQK